MVWSLALVALAVGLHTRRVERGPRPRPELPPLMRAVRAVPVHPALLGPAGGARLRTALVAAGLAPTLGVSQLAQARLALAQVGLAVGAGMALASTGLGVAAAALLGAAGYAGPARWVTLRARRRRLQITRELPDFIDIVVICAESGMPLDGAIRIAAERLPGELSSEISATLRELDLGTPRRDAYAALSDRLAVAPVTGLIGSLLQAEELGSPIARVLRRQATLIRSGRTQDMREHAARAAPKVQLVVAMIMVPAALLVILGVMVIEFVGQIGGVVGGAP
jgi:tight adherence protein C